MLMFLASKGSTVLCEAHRLRHWVTGGLSPTLSKLPQGISDLVCASALPEVYAKNARLSEARIAWNTRTASILS